MTRKPKPAPSVVMVSYWPKGELGDKACIIRHTRVADEAYIAGCQKDDPSACVWIIPGTEG